MVNAECVQRHRHSASVQSLSRPHRPARLYDRVAVDQILNVDIKEEDNIKDDLKGRPDVLKSVHLHHSGGRLTSLFILPA